MFVRTKIKATKQREMLSFTALNLSIHGTSSKALIKYSLCVFRTMTVLTRSHFRSSVQNDYHRWSRSIESHIRRLFTCPNDCFDSRVRNTGFVTLRRAWLSRVAIRPLRVSLYGCQANDSNIKKTQSRHEPSCTTVTNIRQLVIY